MMIAQVTNLKPGTIKHSIKDAHIYVNQVEGIKEQIRREDRYNELSKMNKKDLLKLQKDKQEKLNKLEDKTTKEYKLLDTDNRIIDMILEPSKPVMELNPNIKDFFKFDNSKELKDVKVINYKHMGKIEFPLAQ
jgi:thymidylate synthase